jgi:hypothetical protein
MNRHFFTGAFVLGAAAVIWVAFGFLGTNALALTMTLLIGAVYTYGVLELRDFRRATASLVNALAAIPAELSELGSWLSGVHPSLQNAVRLRIEGERVGLPGPALTPYLLGLLVMLGMLGTFLGMVVTLNGAVFALEGTSDLSAIRSAFATPIKGLGLAFGTSVAGVASSAMLGLMSAVSRRERASAAQQLETRIALELRAFSLTHQRQETLKALQVQSQALPQVVNQLQEMMQHMQRMSLQLNERLLGNQESFHSDIKSVYSGLAQSVDQSLRDSLLHSAQVAGESLQPVVQSAMAAIATEAQQMHTRMVTVTQEQLHAFGTTFAQRTEALLAEVQQAYAGMQATQAANENLRLQDWKGSLETLAHSTQEVAANAQSRAELTLAEITRLLASSEELVQSRIASEAVWSQSQATHMEQLLALWRTELGALRQEEAERGNAAVARLDALQAAVSTHLATLGTALEEPIARLIQTASEAPRAAAEVIGKLRQEVTHSAARDNELLEERSRILETLNTLLASIHHASEEQRGVIDALVSSSNDVLQAASSKFAEEASAEAAKLGAIAAGVTSSAVEVSALGETFGFAVRSFNDANEKLIASLQRIEGALDKSMARSDDQLAYYVAQAREIIDLSISSQKEVVEEMRQLASKQAALAEEAA